MKKIIFNDRFGLTQATISGQKTMTRRVIKIQPTGKFIRTELHRSKGGAYYQQFDFDCGAKIKPPYRVGEIVAVAQSYKNSLRYPELKELIDLDTGVALKDEKGYTNKMFVKAELMPHRIKITTVRAERLQDISDEDCLREGVIKEYTFFNTWRNAYHFNGGEMYYATPTLAFASLIDKVSGKGTWENNHFVWVYEYELINKE